MPKQEMSRSRWTFVLSESLQGTNRDDWGKVVRLSGDPMMDLRFPAVVEQSMADQSKLWTLIVYDSRRRPVAVACLSTFRVDACALMSPFWKRIVHGVRRLWQGYLHINLMLVGVPVSTGHSGLRIAPDADAPQVLAIIDKVASTLARRHGCHGVMFYNLDDQEARQLKPLTDLDYMQVDTLANNELPARFRDYDDLCATLRSRYRRRVVRSRRKLAESGLRITWVTGAEGAADLYTDDVHRLYEGVFQRARSRLELLPAEFFRQMARQFGGQSRFLFAYQGQQIVGFLCSLVGDDVYYGLPIGIDYAVNPTCDLYFNMMFECMDDALRQRTSRIFMGPTADVFKMLSGCVQTRRHMFIRARGALQPLLQMFAKIVFPPVEIIAPYDLYLKQPSASKSRGVRQSIRDSGRVKELETIAVGE